ncbi:MAG: hypothetical protein OEY59_00145 [Deltaproteobacteria bacterium]|nr:hypothetical protein [Deltaproteobacteria bacterium]
MYSNYTFKTIPIDHIDEQDKTFLIRSHPENHDIKYPGLRIFRPIYLQETKTAQYKILSDHFLIEQIKNENKNLSVPALIFPKEEDNLQLWLLMIHQSHFEKKLTPFGFFESLYKVSSLVDKSKLLGKSREFLISQNWTKKDLRFQDVKNIIDKSTHYTYFTNPFLLSSQELILLAEFDEKSLVLLTELLEGIQLKGNKLFGLLQMLRELKIGYKTDIKNLLLNPEIQIIVKDQPKNLLYRNLKAKLSELRNPTLKSLQHKWSQSLEKVHLPEGIKIKHDPYFEQDFIELVFYASSKNQLKNQIKWAKDSLLSNELNSLFDIL